MALELRRTGCFDDDDDDDDGIQLRREKGFNGKGVPCEVVKDRDPCGWAAACSCLSFLLIKPKSVRRLLLLLLLVTRLGCILVCFWGLLGYVVRARYAHPEICNQEIGTFVLSCESLEDFERWVLEGIAPLRPRSRRASLESYTCVYCSHTIAFRFCYERIVVQPDRPGESLLDGLLSSWVLIAWGSSLWDMATDFQHEDNSIVLVPFPRVALPDRHVLLSSENCLRESGEDWGS